MAFMAAFHTFFDILRFGYTPKKSQQVRHLCVAEHQLRSTALTEVNCHCNCIKAGRSGLVRESLRLFIVKDQFQLLVHSKERPTFWPRPNSRLYNFTHFLKKN